MPDTASPAAVRYDFLDWLRVIAIFALLFYHTGMLFVGWDWHIQNAETLSSLEIPMAIAHRLRMPLLFVIAGSGLWFAMKDRSGRMVMRERSRRLLLPVGVGVFLIVPPQLYFERLFRGQWHGGYLDFMLHRVFQFQPYPQGNLSWHHLWFVVYLYAYVVILLPVLLWWRERGTNIRPSAWLYLLAIPMGINEALLKPLFPEAHNLVADWYVFNHYLLLTVYGFLIASMDGAWDWIATQRRKALAVAVSTIVVLVPLIKLGIFKQDTALDSVIANAFTWISILAMLGYGRVHLSFENALIRWARDASYPIYILHQTLIIAIGYFVIQQPWSAGLKYWIVLIGTLISCVAIYELCVRRFAITRVIFGMKARATQHAEPRSWAVTASES
jgi:glucans biosynthesis protein C